MLRLDLPGLGDSAVQPGETDGEVYAIETGRAVGAAVAMLRARFGAVDCQLTGICSGAYHAYRAALSGADVQSLVLINQAAYHWHAGMTLSRSSLVLRLAGVLKERDRLGAFPARGTAMQPALHHLKWRALWAGSAAWGAVRDAARAVGLPLAGDVGAALQAIARRGVAIHVVVADDDVASQLLRRHARRVVVALQHCGALQLDVVADADHLFMTRASRVTPARCARPDRARPGTPIAERSHAPDRSTDGGHGCVEATRKLGGLVRGMTGFAVVTAGTE